MKDKNGEQIVEKINIEFIRNNKKFIKPIYLIINSYMKKIQIMIILPNISNILLCFNWI